MICEACTNSVLSYLLFRQRISKNQQTHSLQFLDVRKSVNNFLRNSSEEVALIRHDQSLILVPASQERTMRSQLRSESKPSVDSTLVDQTQIGSTENEEISESHQQPQPPQEQPEEYDLLVELPEQECWKVEQVEVDSLKVEIFTVDNLGNLTKDKPMTMRRRKTKRNRERIVEPKMEDESSRSDMNVLGVTTVKQEPPSAFYSSNDQTFHLDTHKRKKLKSDDRSSRERTPLNESGNCGRLKNESQIFLDKMTPKKRKELSETISNSKIGNSSLYKCCLCFKELSSFSAIRYHIVSMHLVPKNHANVWVKKRLMKARKLQCLKLPKADRKWICVECSRIFNSEQALRAHLHLYLKNDYEQNEMFGSSGTDEA